MNEFKILLTGDYLHREFTDIIAGMNCALTLQPFAEVVCKADQESCYSLVVIAQSRRGQFHAQDVEKLFGLFANVPVVLLLGSWCEGELRSGAPIPGAVRVYWHQWFGRLNNFRRQIEERRLATWHLPRVCSDSDRIRTDLSLFVPEDNRVLSLGISSPARDGFQMLRDVCGQDQSTSIWIETLEPTDANQISLDAILVDANSSNSRLENRIRSMKQRFPLVPLVLLMNYPRRCEYLFAVRLGVSHVISKPFYLRDLWSAVQSTVQSEAA
jgi:CheY-like chemotaxis protein